MIKEDNLNLNGNKLLSEHFWLKEFASIGDNGKIYSNKVLYDTDIVDILEKLFVKLGCSSIKINSGYRTNGHEMSLSKNAVKNGYHTKGMAVDINCYVNGKVVTAKEIALALEDLGWSRGIGLISKNAVHIDSRTTKYYFDEQNACKSIGTSFYTFYKVDKNKEVLEAIKRVCEHFNLNGEWWLEHYDDNYGKEAIKDLFKKIDKKIK